MKKIVAILINLLQFNIYYQAIYIIDAEEYPTILIMGTLMLFALIYKEIQKLILKLNEKDFYICYFIGFILYGILLICSEDIWEILELIIIFGFATFTNIIASIITGITKFIFEQIFPKKEEKQKKTNKKNNTIKHKQPKQKSKKREK